MARHQPTWLGALNQQHSGQGGNITSPRHRDVQSLLWIYIFLKKERNDIITEFMEINETGNKRGGFAGIAERGVEAYIAFLVYLFFFANM